MQWTPIVRFPLFASKLFLIWALATLSPGVSGPDRRSQQGRHCHRLRLLDKLQPGWDCGGSQGLQVFHWEQGRNTEGKKDGTHCLLRVKNHNKIQKKNKVPLIFSFWIFPQDIARSLKNCTKTFSQCRKYEDEAVTIMSACRTSPTELQQKVKLCSRFTYGLYLYHKWRKHPVNGP